MPISTQGQFGATNERCDQTYKAGEGNGASETPKVLHSNNGIHLCTAWCSLCEDDANQSHDLTSQYHERYDEDIGAHGKAGPSE
jgi:hypothetical protein